MQTVIPQLRMTQADRSLAFYVGQLGFGIDWQHQFEPGLPLFVQLTREGQTIFLSGHAGDCQPGGAVYFWVPDADATYAAFTAQGVQPAKSIEDTPWNTREFTLADPDHNLLRFGTKLEKV